MLLTIQPGFSTNIKHMLQSTPPMLMAAIPPDISGPLQMPTQSRADGRMATRLLLGTQVSMRAATINLAPCRRAHVHLSVHRGLAGMISCHCAHHHLLAGVCAAAAGTRLHQTLQRSMRRPATGMHTIQHTAASSMTLTNAMSAAVRSTMSRVQMDMRQHLVAWQQLAASAMQLSSRAGALQQSMEAGHCK